MPEAGELVFGGLSLIGRRPDQIAILGIARTYQNIRLFRQMTAIENILVGATWSIAQWFCPARFYVCRIQFARNRKRWIGRTILLEFVGLSGFGNQFAHNLPMLYGAQRRLEIARALALESDVALVG